MGEHIGRCLLEPRSHWRKVQLHKLSSHLMVENSSELQDVDAARGVGVHEVMLEGRSIVADPDPDLTQ
jgi:hypothetical protein